MIRGDSLQFSGSSQIGIATVGEEYAVSNFIIEIEKTVGSTTTRSLAQLNAVHYNVNLPTNKYLANITYNVVGNFDDLDFDLTFDPGSNNYTLSYIPFENAAFDVKLSQKSILRSTNPLL